MTRHQSAAWLMVAWTLLFAGLSACGSDTVAPPTDDAIPADTVTPDAAGGPSTASTCPEGYATLTMTVDDSANQTYSEGELLWTGSFSFDESTNTVVYATAWQPTDGPYPPLYDDGPISEGGHEPEGAIAGDHVFGVAVCYLAEQDRLLAYGVLNDDLRWIWLGPNGLLDVPADATDRFDAEGLVIPEHGDRDVEITLDLDALHPDYATIGLETHTIYLKGSMNAWTPVQLLDNGKLGDATAGDGVLTYRHSSYAHGHIGLLRPGQEAQFVFVFAMGDLDPDLAAEYKVDGAAAPEGTAARSLCLEGWEEASITQSPDSKGVTLNTALMVCPDDPDTPLGDPQPDPEDCGPESPCPTGESCVNGECMADEPPACGPDNPCPEGETCADGVCTPEGPTTCEEITCGDGEVCVGGACVPEPEGDCSDQVPCTDPAEVCLNGECVTPASSPEIVLVMPGIGSELGGTAVTLHGSGFLTGATVRLGDQDAGIVSITDTEAVITTVASAPGSVDVTLTNPDGASSTYPDGFTYVEAGSAPLVTTIEPAEGPSSGGTTVTIYGANFIEGATVLFDTATATATTVAPGGASLTTTTPSAPLGSVTVTVTNPDGQTGALTDGFTYVPNLPDWGKLHTPDLHNVLAEVEPVTLSAEVWEPDLTAFEGPSFGLVAEVGYGPAGTTPSDGDTWSWFEASYSHEEGNNEVWTGTLTVPTGTWSGAMRFALGGAGGWLVVDLDDTSNGLQADQLVTIEATEPPAVAIATVEPATVWPAGGTTIALSGVGLEAACSLTLDGDSVPVVWEDPALHFVAPNHPTGEASLLLDCPLGQAAASLVYAASWDGLLDEWPAESALATNTLSSDWSETNTLVSLHVATDGTHLLIGVDGKAQGEFGMNAIAVYVDTDLGASTGITTTSDVTDTDHPVDDTLGGVLTFTAPGFGADVAVATLEMSSYLPGVDDGAATNAGWRTLSAGADLPWLTEGAVHASSASFEAVIALSDLYGEPTGEERSLGFIVRLGDVTGQHLSNQALPEGVEGDESEVAPTAATFTLDY